MASVEEMMTMVWSQSRCVLFAMIGASASSWAQDAKVITYDEGRLSNLPRRGASAHRRSARRNRGTTCIWRSPLLAEVTLGHPNWWEAVALLRPWEPLARYTVGRRGWSVPPLLYPSPESPTHRQHPPHTGRLATTLGAGPGLPAVDRLSRRLFH
jgi:hypothetical protein